MIVALLAACGTRDVDPPHSAAEPVDADRDGAPEEQDCDDADPERFPGADERCNDLDDDCDLAVDDGLAFERWRVDEDGDGFGADEGFVDACSPVDGRVTVGGDCDDGDREVHPEADERCNEVDDDCDVLVDEDAVDATDWFRDRDRDTWGDDAAVERACEVPGYAARGGDCDDAFAEVHPGAAEVCNLGVDDDCDPATDEDLLQGDPWLPDLDHDGFGDDAAAPVLACLPPADHLPVGGDCDDARPDVYPGSVEVCDDVDQDCDQQVDEDPFDPLPWYADADGDGFGDPDAVALACDPVAGRVEVPECDDTDPAVRPGALEVCNVDPDPDPALLDLGRDDDCDPSTAGCASCDVAPVLPGDPASHPTVAVQDVAISVVRGLGTPLLQSSVLRLRSVAVVSDGASTQLLALADPIDDWDNFPPRELLAWDAPLAAEESHATADAVWGGRGSWVGLHTADLTGDGADDLVVHASSDSNGNLVLELPLPPGDHGYFSEPDLLRFGDSSPTVADVAAASTEWNGDYLSFGDQDGDGIVDLLTSWSDGDGTTAGARGLPHGGALVRRGPIALATTPGPYADLFTDPDPDLVVDVTSFDRPVVATGGSGEGALFVPDVDGDGRDDLLVPGAMWGDVAPGPHAWPDRLHGGLALFAGLSSGTASLGQERALLYGVCDPWSSRPWLLGDVSGDGRPDVVLTGELPTFDGGATRQGAVWVLSDLHQVQGLRSVTDAAGALVAHHPGNRAGTIPVSLDDLNGDGVDELVLAEPAARAVYLLLGPVAGPLSIDDADLAISGGPDASLSFGETLAHGDADGDGVDDLLILDFTELWVVSGQALLDAL